MRGLVRSAILATVGLFSKQTPNSELFWPEEEVGGGVWLWSSYPVPAWWILGQSKVNLTGRTVEPLTLDLRITNFPFPAHVNLGSVDEKISASNIGWVWLTRVLILFSLAWTDLSGIAEGGRRNVDTGK